MSRNASVSRPGSRHSQREQVDANIENAERQLGEENPPPPQDAPHEHLEVDVRVNQEGVPSAPGTRNQSQAGSRGNQSREDRLPRDGAPRPVINPPDRNMGPGPDAPQYRIRELLEGAATPGTPGSHETDDDDVQALTEMNAHPLGQFLKALMHMLTGLSIYGNAYRLPSLLEIVRSLPEWPSRMAELDMDELTNKFIDMQFSTASSFMTLIDSPSEDDFATSDTLSDRDLARHNFVRTNFSVTKKFSGTGEKKDGNIMEILEGLTRSQRKVRLSKPEFIDKLLDNFTGTAYQTLSLWLSQGIAIDELYRRMVERFYKDETPDEARTKLRDLSKEHSYTNMLALECEIVRLAKIRSYQFDAGTRRREAYEMTATECLLDCLPDSVKNVLEGRVNQARALKGDYPEFMKIARLAAQYRDCVDRYLAQRAAAKKHRNKTLKVSALHTQVAQGKVQSCIVEDVDDDGNRLYPNPDHQWHNHWEAEDKAAAAAKQNQKHKKVAKAKSSGIDHKVAKGQKNSFQPPPRSQDRKQNGNNGRKFGQKATLGSFPCSLCPAHDHSSADCPKFPPEQRVTVAEVCDNCDWGRFHKKTWCPCLRRRQSVAQQGGR